MFNSPTDRNRSLSGITNMTGYVTFTNVIAGQYSFNIVKDGYQQISKAINFKGQSIKMTLAFQSKVWHLPMATH